jgi:hypothetical protein
MFGKTYYHRFSTSINASDGISSFVIEVHDGSKSNVFTNGAHGYPMQDIAFILPSETGVDDVGNVFVGAAVRSSLSYDAALYLTLPTLSS